MNVSYVIGNALSRSKNSCRTPHLCVVTFDFSILIYEPPSYLFCKRYPILVLFQAALEHVSVPCKIHPHYHECVDHVLNVEPRYVSLHTHITPNDRLSRILITPTTRGARAKSRNSVNCQRRIVLPSSLKP